MSFGLGLKRISNYLQKIAIKYVPAFVVLTLIMFSVAGYFTYRSSIPLAQLNKAEQAIRDTEISDGLFNAMGKWAVERGYCSMALNQANLGATTKTDIALIRRESNEGFDWLSHELANELNQPTLSQIDGLRKNIVLMRHEADMAIEVGNRNAAYDLSTRFFDDYTEAIQLANELQQRVVSTVDCDAERNEHSILSSNICLLHDIWLVSEYAGRERAIIGAAIARKSSLPVETLRLFREKVESAWSRIEKYIDVNADQYGESVYRAYLRAKYDYFVGFSSTRSLCQLC